MNKVHFLNTCWSDAILIESNGHFGFIDVGEQEYFPMIKAYIEKLNIKTLDFIFITHFHVDHYGCLSQILDMCKVNTVYLRQYSEHDSSDGNGNPSTPEYHERTKKTYEELKAKIQKVSNFVDVDENLENVVLGDFNFRLFAQKKYISDLWENKRSKLYHTEVCNENFQCVTLFALLNGVSIYLGGDLPDCAFPIKCMSRNQKRIVTQIKNDYKIDHINIYKAAHHGVSDCNNVETLSLINPDYEIVTNTEPWLTEYGTLRQLQKAAPLCQFLPTGYHNYVFEIGDNGEISYTANREKSLFWGPEEQ